MSRAAIVASLVLLGLAAAAGARDTPVSTQYPGPCATVEGPAWTQTIDETAWLSPPKAARLSELHGNRYNVFVDHVRCAWAARNVVRLVSQLLPRRLAGEAPRGYSCGAQFRHWQWDAWNGDAVRHSSPQTSIGGCSTQSNDAVPGVQYQTFWWTPAKPCRTHGHRGECSKQ